MIKLDNSVIIAALVVVAIGLIAGRTNLKPILAAPVLFAVVVVVSAVTCDLSPTQIVADMFGLSDQPAACDYNGKGGKAAG